VAQPVRGAVVIVSVFDETGHLSANGHGFFVSADGKFIADRSVMTGGVNAVAKVADGAIYNVSGALTQTAPQNLVLLKADATHPLPFLVPSASALADIGNEVAIVLSPIERTNPVLLEEKISGRFTDEAGEWFDVTPALSKTIAGAPVINQRGELIGVVTFRAGKNSCAIRPAAAAATLLSQVSSNMTASWQKIFDANPRIGFLSAAHAMAAQIAAGKIPSAKLADTQRLIFNQRLDAAVTAVLAVMILVLLVEALIQWTALLSKKREPVLCESPYVATKWIAEAEGD
jgi:hypothetical protein